MINIFLKNEVDNEINLVDNVENIAGHLTTDLDTDEIVNFYDSFSIKYWTLDINVKKLTDNPNIISDPWMLFDTYNRNIEKFIPNYTSVPEKKFICMIWKTEKDFRRKIYDFVNRESFDCFCSSVDNNVELTEMPEHYENGYYKDNYNYGVPKEYFKSLIDVVSESYVDFSTHFSEKTYKPLLHKKVFLTYAGPYYYETLSEFGFELYNELFDYSFDKVEDKNERLELFFQELKKVNRIPFDEVKYIIESINPKIMRNHDRLKLVDSEFNKIKTRAKRFNV